MFLSNICKDILNTFWPSLASSVIINLNENGCKNNPKFVFKGIKTEDISVIVVIYIGIKGHHVYKNLQITCLQEQLLGETDPINPVDKYAVAVKKIEQ